MFWVSLDLPFFLFLKLKQQIDIKFSLKIFFFIVVENKLNKGLSWCFQFKF